MRDVKPSRVLFVVLAVWWTSGCAMILHPKPHPPPGCLPDVQVLTNDQRLSAMLSLRVVAYSAGGVIPPIKPESLELVPLDVAITLLKTEHDPAANSRRRRAAAKLAAYTA